MFFSTELLSYKKGPFYRIWKIGESSKKPKGKDLKVDTSKIASELLDWIKREDLRRLSLFLSSALVAGVIKVTREQIRQFYLKVDKSPGDIARKIRLALELKANPIDLKTKTRESNQIIQDEDEIFDASKYDKLEEETEVPNFEDMLKNIDRRAHLMPEHDIPDPLNNFNLNDPIGNDFGENPTDRDWDEIWANPPPNPGDGIFENDDLQPVQPERNDFGNEIPEAVSGVPIIEPVPSFGAEASRLNINAQTSDFQERQNSGSSATNTTNGSEAERLNVNPPDLEMVPEVDEQVLPEIVVENVENNEINPETGSGAPNLEPVPTSSSEGSTGIQLERSPEMPPPRQPPRKRRKLRIDKNPQLDKELMRQQKEANKRNDEQGVDKVDYHFKTEKQLLIQNFGCKDMGGQLRTMLRNAATEEKFFDEETEDTIEEEEEVEENEFDIPEVPQNEASNAFSVASDIRHGRRSNLQSIGGGMQSSMLNPPSVEASQNFEENVSNPIIQDMDILNEPNEQQEGNTEMEIENVTENVPEHVMNNVSEIITENDPENVTGLDAASQDFVDKESIEKLRNAIDDEETVPWDEVNDRAGISTRRQAARLFQALLFGIKENRYQANQETFFGPMDVKKL